MTTASLLLRSLRHYRWWHLGLALAVALAAMVIAGSLAVGDSVRATLAQQAANRIGRVQTVVVGGEKFFTESLVGQLPGPAVPLIMVRGTVALADGTRRVGGVNVIGVTEEFWSLARVPLRPAPAVGASAMNDGLARELGAGAYDPLVVRVEKPSPLSKDAPLSGEADQTATLRIKVGFRPAADAFGDFSLAASQSAPKNLFVPLAQLQEVLQQAGRVNAALSTEAVGSFYDSRFPRTGGSRRLARPVCRRPRSADLHGQPYQRTRDGRDPVQHGHRHRCPRAGR